MFSPYSFPMAMNAIMVFQEITSLYSDRFLTSSQMWRSLATIHDLPRPSKQAVLIELRTITLLPLNSARITEFCSAQAPNSQLEKQQTRDEICILYVIAADCQLYHSLARITRLPTIFFRKVDKVRVSRFLNARHFMLRPLAERASPGTADSACGNSINDIV